MYCVQNDGIQLVLVLTRDSYYTPYICNFWMSSRGWFELYIYGAFLVQAPYTKIVSCASPIDSYQTHNAKYANTWCRGDVYESRHRATCAF